MVAHLEWCTRIADSGPRPMVDTRSTATVDHPFLEYCCKGEKKGRRILRWPFHCQRTREEDNFIRIPIQSLEKRDPRRVTCKLP